MPSHLQPAHKPDHMGLFPVRFLPITVRGGNGLLPNLAPKTCNVYIVNTTPPQYPIKLTLSTLSEMAFVRRTPGDKYACFLGFLLRFRRR